MSPVRIALLGASGRMGRAIVALAASDVRLRLVAALTAPGDAHIGRDAGEVAGVGALSVPLDAWSPT